MGPAVPDPSSSDSPPVAPGNTTSEYKVTRWTVVLSVLAAVVGGVGTVLAGLHEQFPSWGWVGGAMAAVGVISTMFVALGYQSARTQVKVAALQMIAGGKSADGGSGA